MASNAPQGGGWALAGGLGSRILFGVIMVAIALVATLAGPIVFFALLVLLGILVLREWFRLVDEAGLHRSVLAATGGLVVALSFALADHIAVAGVVLLLASALCFGLARKGRKTWAAAGVLYAGIPTIGLILLRNIEQGIVAVLLLFVVVWITDTAAFITGKTVGGPKLWPTVSPNKTWAGFFGGLVGGALVGVFAVVFLQDHLPLVSSAAIILAGVALSLAGQLGDLFESHMKRYFGVKDTGRMIPGHGGAMDRLDSIVAAGTIAGLCVLSLGLPRPHALPSASPLVWLGLA
jgi:phosphatidate cytidylyltransferase